MVMVNQLKKPLKIKRNQAMILNNMSLKLISMPSRYKELMNLCLQQNKRKRKMPHHLKFKESQTIMIWIRKENRPN